ncbi:hypothetical protein OIU85_005179 [Salix viminalis]|uniref:DUF1645 domain-containing protein n=1 Tax=Salix viminalis TaxID=40686 RepID=A0A9Q0PUB1_SALVM|nr:hypothetical protein OIU85_005179 [Salix viminalis]
MAKTSTPDPKTDLENPNNGKALKSHESQYFTEDFDSTCSTPYVSAPSSPGRPGSGPVNGGFFYSCPASPMHFAITSSAAERRSFASSPDKSVPIGYEFEFSAKFGSTGSGQTGSMSSADELFLNGQIRPMKLSSHLERPQVLSPLLDLDNEEEDGDSGNDDEFMNGSRKGSDNGESMPRGRDLRLKNKSLRRRTRSMSPLRSTSFEDYDEENKNWRCKALPQSLPHLQAKEKSKQLSGGVQLGVSKEKSSGGGNNNGTVPGGESQKVKGNSGQGSSSSSSSGKKPVNGVGKRRVPVSPHELHYKASRAQAEEMRKRTFLPYRQGLFGCLGFSSKGYGAMNGIARALNPVSSR